MAEPTTPATGVDSGSDDAAVASLVQRWAPEEPQQAAPVETAEAPVDQAASDELTPDDIPVEQDAPQSAVEDAFEIVHNGQQRKLNREETIKYAQQGFDYTQKTQALAEQQRQVQAVLQRAQEIEQLATQAAPELAQVKALESQLQQWDKVDWVQLATDNPLEYPKHQAQYDAMRRAYAQAVNQYQQKTQAIQQRRQAITADQLRQERTRLADLVPEFKDETKFAKAAGDIRGYLIGLGAPSEAVDALSDALSVSVAYKAMRYDQLLKAKTDKVKQLRTAPPVTRPNAPNTNPTADRSRDLEGRFKKSGDVKDAAALLLNRWRSN